MKSLATIFFTMAEAARVHQAENGERYELIFGSIKDERDLSRQVALIEGMVAAGDAIVIAPADSKALVPVLRRAVRQGVVVVNISNRFDAEVLAAGGVTIPFVGPDSRTGSFRLRSCLPLIPTRLAASHWRRSAAPG
ncbi:MAG: sugar ABC transporter substrate-binding protein [Planctomycetaceae bacterium]|nr:MAG: sugar ABC transporter substrate-binding protein [Planctomycetaceae bacterium]